MFINYKCIFLYCLCFRMPHSNVQYHQLGSKNHKPAKKFTYKYLLLVLLLIGFFIYLIEFSTVGNFIQNFDFYNSSRYWDPDTENIDSDRSYFVNTVGCKMPSFPVHDEFISQYIMKPPKFKCKPIPLTVSDDKYLWIHLNRAELARFYNVTNAEDLVCYYKPFRRATDWKNSFYGYLDSFKYGEKKKIDYEFVNVFCDNGNVTDIYEDYHFFVPKKFKNMSNTNGGGGGTTQSQQGDNRYGYNHRLSQFMNSNNNIENMKFNVMVIGLDSVSRLNFRRQMKKSYRTIVDKFDAIEFQGYNKVGDNTYPNLIPALTGFDVDELKEACFPNEETSYFDKCNFIWDKFSENNYYTAFTEDIGYLGLFNYFRKGFIKQPTDYYTRPLFTEMEHNVAGNHVGNIYLCLGHQRPIDIIFKYVKKFLVAMQEVPFFSFFWSSSMTHDYLNFPILIDDDFNRFLLHMYNRKLLNQTLLFLMSDHGIRWGSYRNTYQGMMEERQPFLYVLLPNEFTDNFPIAVKNLKINRKRLTTHFDLYETFKDLLNSSSITAAALGSRMKELIVTDPVPRGISLFLPVPKSRTCDMAGIATHWCTCHEKENISTSDVKVKTAARYLVQNINKMIEGFPQCQTLYLMAIKEASLLRTNANITTTVAANKFNDVTVRLVTKPGLGEFEGTVRLDAHNKNTNLTGTISRTNLYGKQSYCVDDYILKLYCYCGR